MQHSIAVLGRGIGGLTCAYRFARAGSSVTVFGSRTGATRVATGMSMMKGSRLAEQPLFRLKQAGHKQLRALILEIEGESGAKIMFDGVYEPFANSSEYRVIAEKVYRRQFRGLFQNSLCLDPVLEVPALFYPADFYFDPRSLLDAMEIVLRRLGVQFKEQQINKVSTGNTAGSLAITSEHSLIKSQEFEDVIVAAGAGSLKLLASSGFFVHSLSNVWGETLVCPVPHLSNTAYGLTKMKIAATVLAGQLRLGSSSVAGEGPVLEQMHQSRLGLSQQAAELFEVSNNSVRFEAGLRLKTKSRLPMIGELWFDPEGKYRLRVATGFYKNGLQFSDIAACFHVSQVLKQQYRGPLIPGTNEPLQILAP